MAGAEGETRPLGEVLVALGYCTPDEVLLARRCQMGSKREKWLPLGEVMRRLGLVTPEELAEALVAQREVGNGTQGAAVRRAVS